MRFVTVATDANFHFVRLQRSADHFGIQLTRLGAGIGYPGNGTKQVLLREFLRDVPPDEPVMYVDGYDVIFLAGPDEIERKLIDFRHPFVISAEQNFSLRGSRPQQLRAWLRYPQGPRPYRFLNAGTFVGQAGALLEVFERLAARPEMPSDQALLHLYLVDNPDSMKLDYAQQLFACTGGREGLEDSDYRWVDGRLQNQLTGSFPCVLHCPHNRLALDRLIEKHRLFGWEPPQLSRQERRRLRPYRNRLSALLVDRTIRDTYVYEQFLELGPWVLGAVALVSYWLSR